MNYFKDTQKFVKGKMVFCGIDIHKKHWNLCYFSDGEVVESTVLPGEFQNLLSHTEHFYSSARAVKFVYEAGFSGFHLNRQLTSAGYNCIITPPNRVPNTGGKIKTDKRDANKLAHFFAAGQLKSIYIPPPSIEADRQLLRLRAGYQKKMTRVKNQINSFLHLHGEKWESSKGNKWTKRYIQWLEELNFDQENLNFTVKQYISEYRFIRSLVANITLRLRNLSRNNVYQSDYNRITACKGIGLITGMTFLLELGDMSRFPNSDEFSGYLGLTPSQYSTGEYVRFGHITREGNAHVRKVLVESSWTVIRHDTVLGKKYDRIKAKGTNGKKAIVAVAHSLAIRMRRCILDEVPYDMSMC